MLITFILTLDLDAEARCVGLHWDEPISGQPLSFIPLNHLSFRRFTFTGSSAITNSLHFNRGTRCEPSVMLVISKFHSVGKSPLLTSPLPVIQMSAFSKRPSNPAASGGTGLPSRPCQNRSCSWSTNSSSGNCATLARKNFFTSSPIDTQSRAQPWCTWSSLHKPEQTLPLLLLL